MLIPSHRHRPEDLELWSDLEQADLIRPVSQRLIDSAIQSIQEFSRNHCCITTSWGKDSVTVLHLARLAGVSLPIVYVRFTDQHNPDCDAVRDAWLRPEDDYHEIGLTRKEAGSGRHWARIRREVSPRRITGIRADESPSRELSRLTHGVATDYVCRPILYWRNEDVFAFAAQQRLPLHPAYAMNGGGRWERRHLRTHSIGGKTATGAGRREWEQEYYGDVLRRLDAANRKGE